MKEQRAGITNIIGKGTIVNGKFKVAGSIHIDGTIEGNVEVTESLIIGKSGKVRGEVIAKNCVIGGKVEGSLFTEEKAEFQSGAILHGDIKCKRLVIEEGVVFDGNCKMSEKESIREPIKPHKSTESETPKPA